MSLRDDDTPDVYLTHSGGTIGYFLYEDPQQPNIRQWHPSFIPETAQQIQQGTLSYDDRPKTVSQSITFEDFSGGAGVLEAPAGTAHPTTYSYSRGVDASWGTPVLSAHQHTVTGITHPVTKFYHSPTYGDYALTAEPAVYQLQSGSWVNVATPAAAPTDIMEYGNPTATYLFLALGDSTDFSYSTNGTTFTTVVGEQASYFIERGRTSLVPVLFAIKANGRLRTSTNPILSANWSNSDQIGSSSETVTALVVSNDLIWIMKREGYYTFDGTTLTTMIDTTQLARSNNGTLTKVWINGFILSNYGDRVMIIDPFKFETSAIFSPSHPELNGTITALAYDLKHIYVFLQNAAGNTYICKAVIPFGDVSAETAFHTIAYLGAVTVNAAMVIASGANSPSTTNPVLLYSTAAASKCMILPRTGYRPWEDGNYHFDEAGGTLYSTWVDAGTMSYDKWLNGMRGVALSASGANNIVCSFALDGDPTYTSLLTMNQNGLNKVTENGTITFSRIAVSMVLSTGYHQSSPRLFGLVVDVTPNPTRYRQWTLIIDLGDQQRVRAGGEKRPVAYKRALGHLLAAVGRRVTYEDYFGSTFTVKVHNVDVQGIKRQPAGGGRSQATSTVVVTLSEIESNTVIDDVFIWGQSSWSTTYEWGN